MSWSGRACWVWVVLVWILGGEVVSVNAETGRKFHFIRLIASGGFGSVYLAKELHSDGFVRVVAIKLLHPKWSENEEIASRMRDEARLLGQIRHRHIVDVRDLTRIDGRVAVIMEYLEAVDVKDIIHGCVEVGTTVPVRAALEMFADVASALDAAYNRPPYAGEKPLRVIHRDIKPSNVMVDDQGNAKVLDFGVARADFQGRESETQELAFGSVEYMPPERLFFEPDSPASDVYSLGATLYETLARIKFGKAKLRPALHDQHVDTRLDVVFANHAPGDETVRDEVDLLLTEMLSFDEVDRPTAADSATRMRELAAQLSHEPSLSAWAKEIIPPLVKQAHAQSDSKPSDDALIGRVMEEDSKGFVKGGGPARNPIPAPVEIQVLSEADRAFDALKQKSLEERTPKPAARSAAPPQNVVRTPNRLAVPPPPPRRSTVTPSPPVHQAAATPATEVARVRKPVASSNGPIRTPAPPSRNTPMATAVMAPPPRAEVEPPPLKKSGSPLKMIAAALVTIALVGGLVVLIGFVVFAGSGYLGSGGSTPVAPTPVVEPESTPVLVITGPSVTFTSVLTGTRKLTVRCAQSEAEGEMSATLAGESLGDCTVTAMDSSRLRFTAVVVDVRAGNYMCFVGGEKTCVQDGS